MGDHTSQLYHSYFSQMRRLRSIRHSLTQKSIFRFVHSFICNRIDYCNSVLYGASRFQLDRFQSILNAAARINLRIPKFSHIPAFEACFIGFQFVSDPSSISASSFGTAWSALPWLTSRNSVSPCPQTSAVGAFDRRVEGTSLSESRYNSTWAARLLCVWAGHLEFPTAGGSTNHEKC